MYDYHTHSSFSDDCDTPMNIMVEAAIKKGIKKIAVTDHYDPDYPDPDYPFTINFKSYHKMLNETEERYRKEIDVIKGIEIGIQPGSTLLKCKNTAEAYPYDFIIGSFHCYGGEALDLYDYSKVITEEIVMSFYENMYNCLSEYMEYDVIGHFNIIDRYTPCIPEYSGYMDIIAEILGLLIENGKGIELNTSSFRYGMGDRTTAAEEIIRLYLDLHKGRRGKTPIMTFGSDAHAPELIGYEYMRGTEYLKSLGLKKLALFRRREAEFVEI